MKMKYNVTLVIKNPLDGKHFFTFKANSISDCEYLFQKYSTFIILKFLINCSRTYRPFLIYHFGASLVDEDIRYFVHKTKYNNYLIKRLKF